MQKDFPKVRYPHEIGDFNNEGFDSVDGTDFNPGEGGVLPERKDANLAPPDFKLTHGKFKREQRTGIGHHLNAAKDLRTELGEQKFIENCAYDAMTDAEKQEANEKYLSKHGL